MEWIAFYVQKFRRKKEGLEVFMERQLWPVVGTSDSCMCPDCSDLLSLATGLSNQACRLLAAAFQVFTRLWGSRYLPVLTLAGVLTSCYSRASQPVGLDPCKALPMNIGNHWYLRFIAVAKSQLWSGNGVILWLGVTTTWETILKGLSLWRVKDRCSRGTASASNCWTISLPRTDLLRRIFWAPRITDKNATAVYKPHKCFLHFE